MRFVQLSVLAFFSLLPLLAAFGQQEYVIVRNIEVDGNKKTRRNIITREMTFVKGDTILLEDLADQLEQNRQRIMNTSLFVWVKANVRNWNLDTKQADISITVQELWYIFPIPIFELADRNLTVWWDKYNHSFRRVNYGARFDHKNFSGRADQVKVVIQGGFTHKYEVAYRSPYINKAQTLGLSSEIHFSNNREIRIATVDSRDSFFRDDTQKLFRRFRTGVGLQYRPGLYLFHTLDLKYHQRRIDDTVAILNPDFFLHGKLQQRYFELFYKFSMDYRDFRPLPIKGYYFSAEFKKEGFGIFDDVNTMIINAKYAKFMSLTPKISLETNVEGNLNLIRRVQPYYNNRALGFGSDFIRGYERYVVDGQDYAYLKSTLRYELYNKMLDLGQFIPLKPLRQVPIKLYGKIHSDWGYVNESFYEDVNSLSNELLGGTGFGLDLMLYANKVFSFEYTYNRLGESGFFIHTELSF